MMRERLEQLEEIAVEALLEKALNAHAMMMDKAGLTYGDVPLNDEDFVMFYIDLRDRGVLDNLRVVSPEVFSDLAQRFMKSAPKVMGV